MTVTVTALPTEQQVRALAAFAAERVEEITAVLKQRVPELADEPRTADAELILRVPEALITVVDNFARVLLETLEGPFADREATRRAWRSLLNTCSIWRDHAALPASLRDVLATAEPAAA